nr:MAG TPA: hypothetical protein [Caudoviricetes sp.]
MVSAHCYCLFLLPYSIEFYCLLILFECKYSEK